MQLSGSPRSLLVDWQISWVNRKSLRLFFRWMTQEWPEVGMLKETFKAEMRPPDQSKWWHCDFFGRLDRWHRDATRDKVFVSGSRCQLGTCQSAFPSWFHHWDFPVSQNQLMRCSNSMIWSPLAVYHFSCSSLRGLGWFRYSYVANIELSKLYAFLGRMIITFISRGTPLKHLTISKWSEYIWIR